MKKPEGWNLIFLCSLENKLNPAIVTWLILSGTINYLQIFLVCGHESYRRWGKLFLGYNILSALHWHFWDSLPPRIIEDFIKIRVTDYGRPMKPFFIEIQKFWAWADKFWGIWGTFGRTISTHFGTVSPLSMFSIIQPLFLQKTKPLYPHPKYLFGIGIWIWATKN